MPDLQPYDAVLLVSFGGPEGPDEVMPFMRRVTAGRGIPDERLRAVSEHYLIHFDGVSPINAANRRLLADLRAEFCRRGWTALIGWGNRNAAPFLAEAFAELAAAGARRVVAVLTSAYPSYSSCRQYRENLYDALTEAGVTLEVDLVAPYAHREGFAEAQVSSLGAALARVTEPDPRVLFVTHSIPEAMNATAGPDGGAYLDWHQRLADEVAAEVGARLGARPEWELVFCSRSGSPRVPWTEPDVNDRIRELAAQGVRAVITVPIGFISDHMEVVYDLDIEAAATAREVGVEFVRAATVGTDPQFVTMLADALADRARAARGEAARGEQDTTALIPGGQGWTPCAVGCCPNPRQPNRASLAT